MEKLLEILGAKKHTIPFLIFILVSEALAYTTIIRTHINSSTFHLLIFSLICILTIWIWYRKVRKYPRVTKWKIGIIIWICSENDEQRKRIKNDFIKELKKNLQISEEYWKFFEIHELKEYQSELIINSENKLNTVTKINTKIKGHFYIYWNIIEREEKYIIEPFYTIFHPVINALQKKRLEWILRLLQWKIRFNKLEEIKWFEITKDLISFNSKFLLWIAFAISGNLLLAYTIHLNILKTELSKIRNDDKVVHIRNELKKIVSEESFELADYYIKANQLNEGKKYIDKLIELEVNKYTWFLCRAIYFFKKWNIDASLQSIKSAKNSTTRLHNWEWRFSKAFIHLWNEDYIKFNQEKKQILIKCNLNSFKDQNITHNQETIQILSDQDYYSNTFIEDLIKFTEVQVQNKPDKIQLYFWIWFIYYKVNYKDITWLSYFERFLEENWENDHFLKEEAIKFKNEINNRILNYENNNILS